MKTGRFSVGETLLTIGFVWEGNNKGSLYRRPYQAGLFGIDVEAVVKIEVMELTVVEHHKVPSEFDGEGATPTYDGYVLKDKDGNRWLNQYPYASYSQTSDHNNRVFRRYSVDKNPEQPTVNCTELLDSFLDDVESAIPQLERKTHTAAFKSARQGIKQMLPSLKAIVREAYLQAGALGYDILTTRTECGFARLECVKR